MPYPTVNKLKVQMRERQVYTLLIGVSTRHNISPEDILGRRSDRIVVSARREAARLLRSQHWSLPAIGRALGYKPHSTIANLLET